MRALLVLALLGCGHGPPLPAGEIKGLDMPDRLYCVSHDAKGVCEIYRSAQPTPVQFWAMGNKLGLRTVIKLNTAIEGRDVLPAGVEPMEHPWAPWGPVDHEDVAAALYDLEHAERPTLIHCSYGVDRTGLLVALWRVLHERVSVFAAMGEWRAFGRHETFDALFQDAFNRETGYLGR